jgi:hypothetical protein
MRSLFTKITELRLLALRMNEKLAINYPRSYLKNWMDAVFLSDSMYSRLFGHGRYIGPYAISAKLRANGLKSIVIDYFLSHPDIFGLLKSLLTKDTLVVGISSTFLSPRGCSELAKNPYDSVDIYNHGELHAKTGDELKRWLTELKSAVLQVAPRAKILLGGAKALRAFENQEAYSEIDYICLGAGEDSVLELIHKLKSGRNPEFTVHRGLKLLGGVKLKTEVEACPDAQFSAADSVQPGEALPIEVARGCAFNCKYCHFEKRTSLRKSLELLRTELLRNYERFGTTTYHFTDDCFNDHPEKVRSLCSLFRELPFEINWVSYARVDVAVKFPDTIKMMVDSGARALFWGIESLDDVAARKAGKGTPPDKVKVFLKDFVRDHGDSCLTAASFIIGLPGESKESLMRTRDFICENDVMDVLSINPLMVGQYTESLDMKVIDYADYSRNPAKYGFNKISFDPPYWEHEHMNSIEANELASQIYLDWRKARRRGSIRGIWNYTHLRTLGYTHTEIANLLRAEQIPVGFDIVSGHRFQSFLNAYFAGLGKDESRFKPNHFSL